MSKSLETDACWDRIEREALVREATSETFERLYSLVRKGYRPDFESPYHGVMELKHPSKNFVHDRLWLYDSGLVISLTVRGRAARPGDPTCFRPHL
jgi:hypothetical protein